MKLKPDKIERLYYKKGDIARELRVYPSCLEYWEKCFGDNFYIKKRKGVRLYSTEGLEAFREIHRLLKIEKYTIAGVKQKLILK